MRKATICILLMAILLSMTACANQKQVIDFMPVKNFLYYSNDTIIYNEITHSESGYSFNTLTESSDNIGPVLQYYALMIGEYLSGYSGERLKLSGELVSDGTFFKFESYRQDGKTYTFIEIPINRDPDVDELIDSFWNKSVVPKETTNDKNVKKCLRDNGEVEFVYLSSDIKSSFEYYTDKCGNKDGYQFNNNQISYKQNEIKVTISFDLDDSLMTITQQK